VTYGTNDHWLGTTVMLPISIGNYPNAVATSNRHWPNITGALTYVHTFSPTLTNELLINASRDYHRRGSGDFHTDYAGALGLPNPFDAGQLAQHIWLWRSDERLLYRNMALRNSHSVLAGDQCRND